MCGDPRLCSRQFTHQSVIMAQLICNSWTTTGEAGFIIRLRGAGNYRLHHESKVLPHMQSKNNTAQEMESHYVNSQVAQDYKVIVRAYVGKHFSFSYISQILCEQPTSPRRCTEKFDFIAIWQFCHTFLAAFPTLEIDQTTFAFCSEPTTVTKFQAQPLLLFFIFDTL